MRAGYQCLVDVVRTVKRGHLKIGAIMVAQAHGRSGEYKPHLHEILTDGGVATENNKWVRLGSFPYDLFQLFFQSCSRFIENKNGGIHCHNRGYRNSFTFALPKIMGNFFNNKCEFEKCQSLFCQRFDPLCGIAAPLDLPAAMFLLLWSLHHRSRSYRQKV